MSEILVTEEFLDTYEGEIMFLSQDLEGLSEALKSAKITQEEIELLSQIMLDVHDVFLSSTYTQHIAPIFKEFADFLSLKTIDDFRNNQEAVFYLCAILDDINSYINQYFVERTFSDVYLFQDSLTNSIDFLKSSCGSLNNEEVDDDGSEVFFFDD